MALPDLVRGIAVAVLSLTVNDGISNWIEGAQFLALFGILALWSYLAT